MASSYQDIKKRVSSNGTKKTKSGYETIKEKVRSGGYTVNNGVDQKYIDSFITDANSFLTSNKTGAASEYDTYTDLTNRSKNISTWLNANKSRYDETTVKGLSDMLSSFTDSTSAYGQFKSSSDYSKGMVGWLNPEAAIDSNTVAGRKKIYESNLAEIEEIEKSLPWYEGGVTPDFIENIFLTPEQEALRDKKNRLEAENRQYERLQKALDDGYIEITPEVVETATNRNFGNPTREEIATDDAKIRVIDEGFRTGKYSYDFSGNVVNAYTGDIIYSADDPYVTAMRDGGDYSLIEDKFGVWANSTAEDKADAYEILAGGMNDSWATAVNDGERLYWNKLTPDEITTYYYYLNTEGQDRAYQFLDSLETELGRRATEEREEDIAEADLLERIALNVASVPQNVLGGVLGAYEDAYNLLKGEEINPYSAAHQMMNDARATRETTAKRIDDFMGGAEIPWLEFGFGNAYQALMSGADSIVGGFMLGPTAYGKLMGTSAASSTMRDLYERGASGFQIAAGGLLAGAAEDVFEKFSIENLINLKTAKNILQVLKNVLIQGGIEASEEALTEIANAISDGIIMGSESNWTSAANFAKDVINAGLGGFISGAGMGGGASVAQNIGYSAQANRVGSDIINKGQVNELQRLALEMYSVEGGADAKQAVNLAGKVAESIARGKKPSATTVGKLADLYAKGKDRQDIANITKELTAEGLTEEEATKVAEFAAKVGRGEEVSQIEATDIEKITAKISAAETTEDTETGISTPEAEEAAVGKISASERGKATVGDTDVEIAEFASIKDGKATLKLKDGSTVEMDDVVFASPAESTLYESAVRQGMNAATANAFVRGYDGSQSVFDYALGFAEAYRYGNYGFPTAEMSRDGFSASLNEAQKSLAYGLGKTDRTYAEAPKTKTESEGKVHFVGAAAVRQGLTERQEASIKGIEKIAEALGIDFYLFESPVDAAGKRVGANGWYDSKNNSIHIDIAAGVDGNGVMLFTAAHELTHFIRKWSPEKFDIFADFLLENYAKKGISIESLVQNQIDKAKNNGRDISWDEAYEEVIADSCESFLADGDAVSKIAEIRAKDKTLWEAIIDFFTELVDRIKAAYNGLRPDSFEGRYVAEMLDSAEALREMWIEAVADASKAYNAAEIIAIDASSESVSPAFSERTWTRSDYVVYRDEMAKKIASALDVTEAKAKAYIDDINSIAKIIADDRARLDYQASSFGSAFVSNVEYGGSFDYTTLCKKRRIYTGTFTEIQKRLSDTALTPDDILKIRNLLIEEGIEATCGLCYVEGSRANMGKFAKEFIRLYKRDNPNGWIPNMADVNTPDGVEQMRISHPEVYEQYEYFWNHYGKLQESDPALFASQQKPKLYELRKEYKGEILEHFGKDTSVAKKNRNGGIRMQSFSDFEIVHLIDTMQVIMDMSTVGLAGQAYTKVPDFALAFGDTGLKINLSLIAKGVDENGNLIFDDREGMPHETAFEIRDKYSKNVGTIIVAFTDEQVLAAMADERIDFIIPFHRSQWKKGQYGAMGLPKGTKDYTYQQNEKLIKPTYHEYRGRMVRDKATNYMPNEYWDFTKSGKENAENYLNMCAEENKRPKFYKFLDYDGNGRYSLKEDGSTDGYWKLLIDFKMYDNDGVGSPQEAVIPSFNMDEARRMLDEYKGGHESYPVAYGVVDKFVSEYESGLKYSSRDSSYLEAVNRGDMDTAQRMVDEAAREAGYTPVTRYHQTGVKFNEFSNERPDAALNDSDTPNGFFFKENDHDIGVGADFVKTGHGGSIQMRVYLKHNNMLYFKNRDDAREWYSNNVPGYRELLKKYDAHLSDFEKINSENNKKMFDELIALEESGQSTTEKDLAIMEKYDKIMDEWIEKRQEYETSLRAGMRDLLNKYFIKNDSGYDGIELADDGHRYIDMKREDVHTFIVFKNTQIKSADPVTYDDNGNVIPLSERFNTEDSDIRYSERDSSESNRTLLANALESVAQNDIERKRLTEYKAKIESLDKDQARLTEVRAEIKELSFAKGKRDKARISALREEATKLANRIDNYDRRLVNLETTVLKNVITKARKDATAKEKAKGARNLQAYKEKTTAREREMAQEYRDARAKNVEGRRKTDVRNKIRSIVGDLDKMLKNPTKDRHIPIALQKPVASALAAINMDTLTADERIAEYDKRIEKARAEGREDKVAELTKTRDRIEAQGHSLEDKLQAMSAVYESFATSQDPLIKESYNETISELIKATVEEVGDTPIRNMTLGQLNLVYDMFKGVKTVVTNTNKLLLEGREMLISENSRNVGTELLSVAKVREKEMQAMKTPKKYFWSLLKPTAAMHIIGSDTFTELFNKVRAGEDTWATDVEEAKIFFQGIARKYNYWSWDFKKKYTFKDKTNREFSLTLQQMLSLYAYSKRDQADLHLERGGFVFDDAIEVKEKKHGITMTYTYKNKTPHMLGKSEIGEIISTLTDEQTKFADEAQDYLSTVMGAKGNEVSLKLYDIKLFNEKNYFPLKSSRYYIEYNAEKAALPNLENSGFSRRLTPGAGNPIILSDFVSVWGTHVNDMSTYHAFVLPLKDFKRVYDYSTNSGGYDSVKARIANAYGAPATQYIESLLTDLNGGARTDPIEGLFGKPLALFKKASTFMSASVVIQQPSALARAFAYIEPKYFVTDPKIKGNQAEWDEIKKYAPVAIIKEMGYFDIGVGRRTAEWITEREYDTLAEKGKAMLTDSGYRDEMLSKAPAIADRLAWVYIWEATKRKVATEQKLSGEALLQEAGKVYTEAIVNTQVYDSVLSRSQIMRSKQIFAKMLTAFMAEPLTSVNMLVDGIAQATRGNKKFLRSTVASVVTSYILNSALVSIVYAARDDDEDETYGEKYLQSFATEIVDSFNILTYLPYIKDIWSLLQGYSVDRADMTLIDRLVSSINALGSEKKSGWEKARGLIESICSLFGIPVRNILRDAEAIYNVLEDIINGSDGSKGIGEAVLEGISDASPKVLRGLYDLSDD